MSDVNQLLLNDFQRIFSGSIHSYGQHIYKYVDGEVKEQGDNRSVTKKLLTTAQYQDHLNGKVGLGIIPINEDSMARFGVIDVDVYGFNLDLYVKAIERNDFPIVPFRSKSGGLHLYTFYKEEIPAKAAIEMSRKLAGALAIDMLVKQRKNELLEIFPKQYKLQDGQTGNWINLPYYNAKKTKTPALLNGEELRIDNAIDHIKSMQRSLEDVKDFLATLPFNDAPPCLQTLYLLNPLEKGSGRNNYMFGFGTYLKKKDENFFEQQLFDVNQSMKDPIGKQELEMTVLQSLRKKEYNYACTTSPMVDYCNKSLCKTREYGVGKEDGYFSTLEYGKLFQIKTSQPYYEWEVKAQGAEEYKLLRFKNEDEIIKQDVFLKLCFRALHNLPPKLKQVQWFKIVNQSLEEVVIVNVDEADDTSPDVIFRTIFFDFLLNRAMAQSRDQISNKRVFHDRSQGTYLFRTKDLMEYLYINKNFRHFTTTEIHGILKDMGCTAHRIHTESRKQLRIYAFPQSNIQTYSTMEEASDFKPDFSALDQEEKNIVPLKGEYKEDAYE